MVTKEQMIKVLRELGITQATEFPPHDPDSRFYTREDLAEEISKRLNKILIESDRRQKL